MSSDEVRERDVVLLGESMKLKPLFGKCRSGRRLPASSGCQALQPECYNLHGG